eukprot:scaffold742_cov263-Pinguiococcus_pyrenoidosus.AAC.20
MAATESRLRRGVASDQFCSRQVTHGVDLKMVLLLLAALLAPSAALSMKIPRRRCPSSKYLIPTIGRKLVRDVFAAELAAAFLAGAKKASAADDTVTYTESRVKVAVPGSWKRTQTTLGNTRATVA